MNRAIVPMVLSLAIFGCTTMDTVEMPSETLRQEIREGNIIFPGDRICAHGC